MDIAKTWKIEFLHVVKFAHESLPPLQNFKPLDNMTCMDGAALRKVFVKSKSSGMHEIYYNIENNLFVPVSADEK